MGVFASECFPSQDSLAWDRQPNGPTPDLVRACICPSTPSISPSTPVHQPQLAKGGRAVVLVDIWFMGKRAVQRHSPPCCVCIIRLLELGDPLLESLGTEAFI